MEVEEATTTTETSEVVLPDGPIMTMITLETTIDDHFVGLLAGDPPGADPPVGTTGWTTRRQPSPMAHATA